MKRFVKQKFALLAAVMLFLAMRLFSEKQQ